MLIDFPINKVEFESYIGGHILTLFMPFNSI